MEDSDNRLDWFKWIFMRRERFAGVTLLFESKQNPTSPRYEPLFRKLKSTRVVIVKGLPIPKTDRLMLTLLPIIEKFFRRKLSNYQWYHSFGAVNKVMTNQAVHLDDPQYSVEELERLEELRKYLHKYGKTLVIICTNRYSEDWFKRRLSGAEVRVLSQGYTSSGITVPKKNERFSCVYTSPFIHYKGDRHANHTTWGSLTLFDEIIPSIFSKCNDLEIHLIGSIGANAKEFLAQFPNVICHGLVNRLDNAVLLSASHVGLYPRTHDHKRSVQKVFEYIGAGLPIVTFDLTDTHIVKDEDLGIVVQSPSDFADAILMLRNNKKLLKVFESKVIKFREGYSWESLAKKLDQWQESNFSSISQL